MKYKMFVSDLDGTLLDDKKQISKENIKAIKALEEKGIKFVVATGRTKYFLGDFLDIIDYKMPLITSNGSVVTSMSGEVLFAEEISAEIARDIIDITREHQIEFIIHTLDGIVGEKDEGTMAFLKKYNSKMDKSNRVPLFLNEDLYDDLEEYGILKLSTRDKDPNKLRIFRQAIKHYTDQTNAVFSEDVILDITSKQASKGMAVMRLAKKYNIKPEEIVTIGDSENDLSMLEVCGLPLTLENGSDLIKKAAKHITKDCNDSGVADAINRFVLS